MANNLRFTLNFVLQELKCIVSLRISFMEVVHKRGLFSYSPNRPPPCGNERSFPSFDFMRALRTLPASRLQKRSGNSSMSSQNSLETAECRNKPAGSRRYHDGNATIAKLDRAAHRSLDTVGLNPDRQWKYRHERCLACS